MNHATVQDTYAAITSDPSHVLVDIREPAETAEVSIPHAILLPLSEFVARVNELRGYGHVYFICRSGGRSMQAVMYAESVGINHVSTVDGGIIAWIRAKLPTKTKD